MKKNIISVICCLLLCSQAYGQTWNIGYPNAEDVTATLSGKTLTISGTGAMKDFGFLKESLEAPWYNNRYSIEMLVVEEGVTTIGNCAFNDCSVLSGTLTIPKNITTIGDYAFSNCLGLNGLLSLPDSLTTIGNSTFNNCSGLSGALSIPEGVTAIGFFAFRDCIGLTSLSLPESLATIGDCAFVGCIGLTGAITIPESVMTIGSDAFSRCIGISAINVDASNLNYSSDNGMLYDKNKITLIKCPEGKNGVISLSEGIMTIGSYAFSNCFNISSVAIPNSVTTIKYMAFANCTGLNGSLTIPASIMTIESYAFQSCSGLSSIFNFAITPQSLNGYEFAGLTLSDITLYVPATLFSSYQGADVWKKFNVVALPEISEDDINITPTDNNVLIEWQPYENAEGYRLIIYADEVRTDTIYIFEFDAFGKLSNTISFRSASANFSRTIENLLSGTDYYYTLEILGIGNVVLASLSDKFTTTGEPTNINVPLTEPAEVVGYYSILGAKLLQEPAKGMYIILYSNGKTEKVLR